MNNMATMKRVLMKSPERSGRPVWTRRRPPTTPSCWQTGSLFSRWRRRRRGRRSRRPSARRSRSCKSDNAMRRTAPGETTSGEWGSKRKRSGYIKMQLPKNRIERQSWNKIKLNKWSKFQMLREWKMIKSGTKCLLEDRKNRSNSRMQVSRRWYASRGWTRTSGKEW